MCRLYVYVLPDLGIGLRREYRRAERATSFEIFSCHTSNKHARYAEIPPLRPDLEYLPAEGDQLVNVRQHRIDVVPGNRTARSRRAHDTLVLLEPAH